MYEYPVRLKADTNGTLLVTFRDVPGRSRLEKTKPTP